MRIVSNLPRVAIRVAPAIHAAQHERAGRAKGLEARPALPLA